MVLGLSAGSVLTEGAVMVPDWRSMPPADFLQWYAANAARLFNFFGPLEMAATLLAIAAAIILRARRRQGAGSMGMAAALSLAVLLTFPMYFRDVNLSFEHATIAPEQVPAELTRWAAWHWARTAIAIAAFVAALSSTLRAAREGDPR